MFLFYSVIYMLLLVVIVRLLGELLFLVMVVKDWWLCRLLFVMLNMLMCLVLVLM